MGKTMPKPKTNDDYVKHISDLLDQQVGSGFEEVTFVRNPVTGEVESSLFNNTELVGELIAGYAYGRKLLDDRDTPDVMTCVMLGELAASCTDRQFIITVRKAGLDTLWASNLYRKLHGKPMRETTIQIKD